MKSPNESGITTGAICILLIGIFVAYHKASEDQCIKLCAPLKASYLGRYKHDTPKCYCEEGSKTNDY